MRLEEPDAKRQRPDLAGVEGDFKVPDEDWEFTLPGTATYQAAGADQGQTLEACEAAGVAGKACSTATNERSDFEQEKNVDDIYGTLLNPTLVRKARQLELDWIKSREVYKRVPLRECIECTGKKPLCMKWVDTDKGDEERPNYRSRLVCGEVKKAKRPGEQLKASELFSSMPPLEGIKTLCSLCMSLEVSPKGKPLKLALWDISRARLYSDAQRDLYVELPPEDEQLETDTEPMCGLLLRCTGRKTRLRFGRKTTPNC
eukprot:2754893-Amphidinium_carterae.3